MNLFYQELPKTIDVNGQEIQIITDFREYVRLIDMLKDTELDPIEKKYFVEQYFKEPPQDFEVAMEALTDFVTMSTVDDKTNKSEEQEEERVKKDVYSFQIDYPFIFSAFLHDYGINIRTIPYMHWWEFRMLFAGLSDDTEIKQRIRYRSIDLSEIKDKEERKRIEKIQRAIRLPEAALTDYDIGDAFEW